jgi:hypothetical protein
MMVSGAVAVTVSAYRHHQQRATFGFADLSLVLVYALAENIREKPDGIAISALLILGIVGVSRVSRITRTTELRVDYIEFDPAAREFIEASLDHDGGLHIIANQRQTGDVSEYAAKEAEQRTMNPVPDKQTCCSSKWTSTTHRTSATSFASAGSPKARTTFCGCRARRPRTRSPQCCSH